MSKAIVSFFNQAKEGPKYNIELYYDRDEKMFTVTVPALPGCVTQGKDIEQCIDRAREAILCHKEALAPKTIKSILDQAELPASVLKKT